MCIFKKWACLHTWKTHAKKEDISENIYHWNSYDEKYEETPLVEVYTIEVLICEKCGKIKKIKY